jgi:hypothetical protein
MLGDSKARAATQRRAAPCARCGELASAEAWGHPLCAGCWGEWLADEQFAAGDINRHLGLSNSPEEFTSAGHARYCAEATQRTTAWVRQSRRPPSQ